MELQCKKLMCTMDDSAQASVGRDKEGEKSKSDDETAVGTGGSREGAKQRKLSPKFSMNVLGQRTVQCNWPRPLAGRKEVSSSEDVGLQEELGIRVVKTGKRVDDVGHLISSSTSNGKKRRNEERYSSHRKTESNGKLRLVQITSATRNSDCRRKYARHRSVNQLVLGVGGLRRLIRLN
ncbi:hypothetical protein Ancab_019318 [Ancistrocladus abbreviatus]